MQKDETGIKMGSRTWQKYLLAKKLRPEDAKTEGRSQLLQKYFRAKKLTEEDRSLGAREVRWQESGI
ncbi:MAG: hypothetical protein WCO56_27745 [Verrucomicrobiota bacterium]